MTNMKKFASLLLALVMVLTMTATAFAATITVTSNEPGTYNAYKIFDLTYNVENSAYTYSIDSDSEWFTVVKAYADVSANGLVLTTNEEVDGVTTYVVTVTGDFDAADFAAALAEAKEGKTQAGTATIGEGETTATITVAEIGYYFVDTTVGSLCILHTTTANVDVTEKNTVPTVDKEITDFNVDNATDVASAAIGTVIPFEATITIGKGLYECKFEDTMSSGLTFDENSVVVKIGDVPVNAENYTVTTGTTPTFTVAFEDDYVATLAKDTVVTITYSATLNGNALETDVENNTAKLIYKNDPRESEKETPEDETFVYDFDIVVDKYAEGDEDKKLVDAKFVLMNAAKDAYYAVDGNGNVSWVPNIEDAKEVSTDANGAASFKGLKIGTYYLVETEAPAGYNKLTEAVKVEVSATVDNETITVTGAASSNKGQYIATESVSNQSGQILPSTGGIGTTIFYISGAVLAIAAVVFLVTKKRMSGVEE